jgi:branched-chain amino acid transport system substrate-binding protein
MSGLPASALLSALGVALALEAIYAFVLRRYLVRLIERVRYQAFVGAWTATTLLGLADVALGALQIAAFLAAVVSVDLVYRLIDRFWLSQQRDRRGRLAIPKLVRDLAAWILILAAIVIAGHQVFDIGFEKFTLSVTVLSAVVGFALQDVLKNVFAGLALQTEAPFDTGDWVVINGEPRQVLEMTWRSTHLRNNLGVEFREPNSNLANAEIVNLGSGEIPVGFEIEVSLTYGAPPQQVRDSLERAARSAPAVATSPPPQAFLTSFGDSGILYRLRFWTSQVQALTRVLGDVRSRVWYQLKRDGFTIPFPIRTVEHVAQRDLEQERRAGEVARVAELLESIDFLAALPEGARRQLAQGAHKMVFDAGERLVVEGEKGDSLYVVSRGTVLVSKSGAEIGTSNVELATLGAGDYFGEMSLLTGAGRSATVTAEDGVEAFVLDRSALAPILHGDPSIAETLSRVLARRMAEMVARVEDRRDELRKTPAAAQHTLLQKIRSFFRLGA